MAYSPLAIHCTSLCCDILQARHFQQISHQDIDWLYDEVYELIKQRTELWPDKFHHEHTFIDSVARGVLKALHICKNKPNARDPDWLLIAMQSRINFSLKKTH
ncbi:hypothetical protein [Vibrio celticus]|uniref:Uncharacterized protein n=1 Tax=Vibrio celticus TaxID=446372 RepID=A0A1C3JA51_9VIBR|nr:hypothetical protein [Vibrio celticus]SBT11926.1 hypothetical protein VCE7224_00660 [Vibrio celticus]